MLSKILSGYALLACATAASAADFSGDVLFEQLPDPGVFSGNASGDWRHADDFTLSGLSTITGLDWWGADATSGLTLSRGFVLTFYIDDNGLPGQVLLQTTGTVTESQVQASPQLYLHTTTLNDPFVAQPDTRYWIDIHNELTDWAIGNSRMGNNIAVSIRPTRPTWAVNPGASTDLAFRLRGVPEPSSFALLGLGWTILLRRGRATE